VSDASYHKCQLDYCNALLYGISGGLIQRLQSVQNAAARLVTGASPTWSYHSGAETAPLVACETENWFQIGGACLQVISWSCSAVPVGQLPTRHGRGTSTSQVFRRLHVCRPTDTVADWRQEFLCMQLHRGYGTTYRQRAGGEALRSNIIDDYLRRFCSFRLRRIVTFYLSVPDISTLTHSLSLISKWQTFRNEPIWTHFHNGLRYAFELSPL